MSPLQLALHNSIAVIIARVNCSYYCKGPLQLLLHESIAVLLHESIAVTGELGYDRLNGTRKIGPSYAKSVVYI